MLRGAGLESLWLEIVALGMFSIVMLVLYAVSQDVVSWLMLLCAHFGATQVLKEDRT
jgi:hypothetical protein